jgi:dephospho-CoA kinase
MLRIGLTGGIGSGKSTVAGIFEVLGIPVSHADEAARLLMNEEGDLKTQIIRHFGEEAYSHGDDAPARGDDGSMRRHIPRSGGALNRSWMAAQVFNDPKKLELLNSLVHPATIRAGEKWMEQQDAAKAPYAIREAAVIFESRAAAGLDYIIGVAAPAALRIHRAMQRDKITREKVQERMKNQIDEELKMRLCDFVIRNDEQEALLPQVLGLHEKLLLLAGAPTLSASAPR